MEGSQTMPRLRLRLSPVAESVLRAGHPWVFEKSIRELNRPGQSGELAVIYDRNNRFLALGLFDPDSPIRVRVLQAGRPETLDAKWWSARLDQALERRAGLFDALTTSYRCIHGESDGWPGMVLDRYDTSYVLKLYTASWFPWLEEIIRLMQARLKFERLVLRLSRNMRVPDSGRHWADQDLLAGSPPGGPVPFLESGLRFEADLLRGQKTGFFLDQRENRRVVETLSRGRSVLNAFSFSGGFSLYAARGGARSVTDLDISQHALASAGRNFALNQSEPAIQRCRRDSVQADAFEWLAGSPDKQFDLVVLDPPSLARREAERSAAVRAYEKLAFLGMQHVSRNGILVACSCSAHVSSEEFFQAVRQSAQRSRRRFEEIRTTGHPPDHPATFKEAAYLKALYLKALT
jgi:23S rRNA (cytosine1962-C5)-methyltransferase